LRAIVCYPLHSLSPSLEIPIIYLVNIYPISPSLFKIQLLPSENDNKKFCAIQWESILGEIWTKGKIIVLGVNLCGKPIILSLSNDQTNCPFIFVLSIHIIAHEDI
jgi:hypothetical protein